MKLSVRMNSEASQYFQKRMSEWHLNQTETLHKLIGEIQRLETENAQQVKDLETYRQLVKDRPFKSIADKQREDFKTDCLRGLRFSKDQAPYFCDVCSRNHSKEYQACQKLSC